LNESLLQKIISTSNEISQNKLCSFDNLS